MRHRAGWRTAHDRPATGKTGHQPDSLVELLATDLSRQSKLLASGSGAPSLPISYAYQYNRANQRTRASLADGAYWVYQYDALGQVISGKKYWSDGTPVAGQQFEDLHLVRPRWSAKGN